MTLTHWVSTDSVRNFSCCVGQRWISWSLSSLANCRGPHCRMIYITMFQVESELPALMTQSDWRLQLLTELGQCLGFQLGISKARKKPEQNSNLNEVSNFKLHSKILTKFRTKLRSFPNDCTVEALRLKEHHRASLVISNGKPFWLIASNYKSYGLLLR